MSDGSRRTLAAFHQHCCFSTTRNQTVEKGQEHRKNNLIAKGL
jgi:hypothetical protein